MNEYTLNLHMHTTYSDGSGSHADLAEAAHDAG
ncbi:MAG: phosphatase, partial [Anaerolineae bacterium]